MARTAVVLLTVTLTLTSMAGAAGAEDVAPTVEPRSAVQVDDGCGTGIDETTELRAPLSGRGGYDPGSYRVRASTCEANGRATGFREHANRQSYCTASAAFGGTAFSFFLGVKKGRFFVPAVAVALVGAGLATGCELVKTNLNSLANQITEAAQRCGTRGIEYTVDGSNASLRLSGFACQAIPGGEGPKLLNNLSEISFDVYWAEPDSGDRCQTYAPRYFHVGDAYYEEVFDPSDPSGKGYVRSLWNPRNGVYEPTDPDGLAGLPVGPVTIEECEVPPTGGGDAPTPDRPRDEPATVPWCGAVGGMLSSEPAGLSCTLGPHEVIVGGYDDVNRGSNQWGDPFDRSTTLRWLLLTPMDVARTITFGAAEQKTVVPPMESAGIPCPFTESRHEGTWRSVSVVLTDSGEADPRVPAGAVLGVHREKSARGISCANNAIERLTLVSLDVTPAAEANFQPSSTGGGQFQRKLDNNFFWGG